MLKAKEDKAERQLSPGLCSELSAEVPGQNPPLEGLDSGGKGSQSTPNPRHTPLSLRARGRSPGPGSGCPRASQLPELGLNLSIC